MAEKFQKYGINVLRIFSQWDQKNPWVDVCPECSSFQRDGTLREKNIARLKEILADAGRAGHGGRAGGVSTPILE